MIVLKRIGVLSLALTWGIIFAVLGLIMGIFTFLMGTVSMSAIPIQGTGMGIMAGTTLGAFVIVLAPIIGFIEGFIGGAIGAWLYNLVAKWTGGVKLEFTELS